MDQRRGIQVASWEMVDKIYHFAMSNVRLLMGEQYDETFAEQTGSEIEERFHEIILDVPSIGEEKNPLTGTLIWSTVWLAVYEVMRGHGYHVSDVGKMIYDDFCLTTKRFSDEELQRVLENRFSSTYLDEQREMALQSQKFEYPNNWEYYFVEDDGGGFDWGIDYRKCAICTLYHTYGADELVQFICLTDFYSSKALGLGLERTMTIADGFEICNFRYKRGRATKPNWIPDFVKDAHED